MNLNLNSSSHLDKELVTASNRFHEALATGDYKGFCAMKAATAETVSDQQVRTVHTHTIAYLHDAHNLLYDV